MAALIAALAGCSVATAVVAMLRPNGAQLVRQRIERMWVPVVVEESDEPFSTRVLKPLGEAMMRSVSRLLPQTLVVAVDLRLQSAGMTVSARQFVGWWLSVGVALPAALLLLTAITGSLSMMPLMLFGGWLAAGGMLPWRTLNGRAESHRKEIDKELPDVIDMIVTSVEAGLGMQQAMMTVADKFEGLIASEFGRVLAEIQMGRSRSEAMLDMAERTGSRDLTLFVRAVNQADEMGFAIGQVLRVQSREVRERKEQSAREQAAKIPVKMTIPTTIFMLPTIFIVVLTPVILSAMDAFSGKE